MALYRTRLDWTLGGSSEDFLKGRYSRGHALSFEGGPAIRSTASAHVVGAKWAEAGAADPEQMLVGALSTCHMLSFLHVAREAGFAVTAYADEAEGLLEKTADGRVWITRVALRPAITYAGATPSAEQADHLHHLAHEACFIANSVKTEVVLEAPALECHPAREMRDPG